MSLNRRVLQRGGEGCTNSKYRNVCVRAEDLFLLPLWPVRELWCSGKSSCCCGVSWALLKVRAARRWWLCRGAGMAEPAEPRHESRGAAGCRLDHLCAPGVVLTWCGMLCWAPETDKEIAGHTVQHCLVLWASQGGGPELCPALEPTVTSTVFGRV